MFDIILIIVVAGLLGWGLRRAGVGSKGAEENRSAGSEYLEQNKSRAGVECSSSGLQWEILQAGNGSEHPSPKSRVRVHYHGTLINGKVFDSSVERGEPISFRLNQVIPGWTEGVQQMVTGEKRRLFIPADLGYGNHRAGDIPPGSVLIFDVELIAIED